MRKLSKALLTLALSATILPLASCSVNAKPSNVDDKIVNFAGTKGYFRDTYSTLYENYIDGGSASSATLEQLVNLIAEDKLVDFFGSKEAFEAELVKLSKEKLVNKVKGGSYDKDSIFQEEKLVKELRSSLYDVKLPEGKTYNNSLIITPDMDVEDFDKIFNADYQDYFKKSYYPEIYKTLLTAQYMVTNEYSTLGRAQARKVSFIKIDKLTDKPNAVSKLINDWLDDFVNNGKTTTEDGTFDLNSLAKIWKGVDDELTTSEKAYVDSYYNLNTQLNDEIGLIATKDETTNTFIMKDDIDIDTTIEDKYTNSGAYTLDWGYTLAQRALVKKSLTGNDLYTKSSGIEALPDTIKNRLFSASMEKYLSEEVHGVRFLTPSTYENGNSLTKYYHYDLTSNSYYIVVVEPKTFTKSELEQADKDATTKYSADTLKIAEFLGDSSSNQREALIKYMEEYDIAKNIHDQDFYDYLYSNYSEIFD